ncbi:RNA dependent RNA polymerase-domain-containing protein [Powellomyces hirtus]|nr:RNA dependent RNA polymerase-domain-containing protein [Powellomyces hirtus]
MFNQNRGHAFVRCADVYTASRLLALNNRIYCNGRRLRIDRNTSNQANDDQFEDEVVYEKFAVATLELGTFFSQPSFQFRVDHTLDSAQNVTIEFRTKERVFLIAFERHSVLYQYRIHIKDLAHDARTALLFDENRRGNAANSNVLYMRLSRVGQLFKKRNAGGGSSDFFAQMRAMLATIALTDSDDIRCSDCTALTHGSEGYISRLMTLKLTFRTSADWVEIRKACQCIMPHREVPEKPVPNYVPSQAIQQAFARMAQAGKWTVTTAHPALQGLPSTVLRQLDILLSRNVLDVEVLINTEFADYIVASVERHGAQHVVSTLTWFEASAETEFMNQMGAASHAIEELEDWQILEPISTSTVLDRLKSLMDPVRYGGLRDMVHVRTAPRMLQQERDPIEKEQVMVYHAIVTPLRVHFSGPFSEQSNRLLRRHAEHHDRFLRVDFSEESMDRCMVGFSGEMDSILDGRFSKILNEGLALAGRTYKFLAFSSSQLRQHSCWFFAAPQDDDVPSAVNTGRTLTCDAIRAELGDFSHIDVVAKYAARMGQALTSTIPTMHDLPSARIPDIERKDPNTGQTHIFTDGCGQISPELAGDISDRFFGESRDPPPSVFQIRYGGAKGVVAVNPLLTDHVLYLRPSQIKFEHSSTTLEVAATTDRLIPAFLNRQAITLLSGVRGVPDKVFLDLQQRAVDRLNDMMTMPRIAIQELAGHYNNTFSTNSAGREREKRYEVDRGYPLAAVVRTLHKVGYPFLQDEYLRTLLDAVRLERLTLIKEKSRIPLEDSYTLMGVCDETGILEQNEVFVFLSTEQTPRSGACTVLKFPAFHPGDVMQLTCVANAPALYHLRNCIVFSTKGIRPTPNMLSGSDLDGDLYSVYFDPALQLHDHNRTPMNYDPHPPKRHYGAAITARDITAFFLDFMRNDRLGLIAMAHLANADMDGPQSEKCLLLARAHSVAVDYNKSGVPAQMPKELSARQRPHFMANGRGRTPTYTSKKVLGQLFDAVNVKSAAHPRNQSFDLNTHKFLCIGYEHHMEELSDLAEWYTYRLHEIRRVWQVGREANVIAGCVPATGSMHRRRKAQDLAARINADLGTLVRDTRAEILHIGNGEQNTVAAENERRQRAAACFALAYCPGPAYAESRVSKSFRGSSRMCWRRIMRAFEVSCVVVENTIFA